LFLFGRPRPVADRRGEIVHPALLALANIAPWDSPRNATLVADTDIGDGLGQQSVLGRAELRTGVRLEPGAWRATRRAHENK
jgi:hypothetical protein